LLGWTAVEDPARFTAQLLAEEMRAAKIKGDFRGVSTRGYPEARLPDERELREVLSYTSPPLELYLTDVLADSQNLYAESIARAVAIDAGLPASFEGAAAAITAWAEKKGMMRGGFALMDGSGLSALNMLPPRSVGDLLMAQRMDRPRDRMLREALAIAGESGTLTRRLESVSGRFQGKTGVLKDATTLAGYLRLTGGREYVVVLMIDKSTAPVAAREKFLDSLVEELDTRLSPTITALR
jgi:D-alanyl-D-alanine carboxypeptidase/D-alanyl-D-alanine-endopeptidase (penicillin-binding protein 4)